jgi:S1-C subfamily serine protease
MYSHVILMKTASTYKESTSCPTIQSYVGRIRTGSIAERAGLAVGDVIIQLNSQPISDAAALERFIAGIKQGDKLSIIFIRGTGVNTVEVTA